MPKKDDLTQLIQEFRKEVNAKLDTHTKILDSHSAKHDSHSSKLDTHTKILDSHSTKLDSHTMILDSHGVKLDAHTADIHDLKDSVMGALDGVKLSLDKLAPLEKISARTVKLEREVGAIKTAIKNISAAK